MLGRQIIARRSRVEDAAIVELIRVGNNLNVSSVLRARSLLTRKRAEKYGPEAERARAFGPKSRTHFSATPIAGLR